MGVYLSKANVEAEIEEGEDEKMEYVVGDVQGWRRNMEDAHIASLDISPVINKELGKSFLPEKEKLSIFGVFDGHGGKEVAKFVQIKFIREFVKTKHFRDHKYKEALRSAFHRIDDMLEDEKYGDLLNTLKNLPNPSDGVKAGDHEVEDRFGGAVLNPPSASSKKNYVKFNPYNPEYDSDDDDEGKVSIKDLANAPIGGLKGNKKKKLTKTQAVELFSALILKETKARVGVEEDDEDDEESEGEEDQVVSGISIPKDEWTAYYNNPNHMPGNKPRPTLQTGPASVAGLQGLQCNLKDHRIQAGCTSVVVFRIDDTLLCANAGDSRAVLCRGNGEAYFLSEDHKPSSAVEMDRIEKAGGFVNQNGRINSNLNLSRSLGDMKYKQVGNLLPSEQMITAEPDITETKLLADDKFFVVACDGVWDILSNQEICDFILERMSASDKPYKFNTKSSSSIYRPAMTTKEIVEDIFDYCVCEDPKKTQGIGGDNMTCMIVNLK